MLTTQYSYGQAFHQTLQISAILGNVYVAKICDDEQEKVMCQDLM